MTSLAIGSLIFLTINPPMKRWHSNSVGRVFALLFLVLFCRAADDDDFEQALKKLDDGMRRLGQEGTSRLESSGGNHKIVFRPKMAAVNVLPSQPSTSSSRNVVLKSHKPLEEQKRRKYQKQRDLQQGPWDVNLNTYHMSTKWNRAFGRALPAYHSAISFKGPGWAEGGTEFSYGVGNDWDAELKERAPGEPGYNFRKSKHMGRTRMNPRQVRRHVQRLRDEKYGKDDYHITKRNCNHCAKDILTKALGRKPPSRHNRLARILGRMGLNALPLG